MKKEHKDIFKNYPGAKNNSGLIQFLINNIPLHERYLLIKEMIKQYPSEVKHFLTMLPGYESI